MPNLLDSMEIILNITKRGATIESHHQFEMDLDEGTLKVRGEDLPTVCDMVSNICEIRS